MNSLVRIDSSEAELISILETFDAYTFEEIWNDAELELLARRYMMALWIYRAEMPRPACLDSFYRVMGNYGTFLQKEAAIEDGSVDDYDALTLALFAATPDRKWHAKVAEYADTLRNEVIEKAPNWHFVITAKSDAEDAERAKQHCKCETCVCD